MSSHKYAQLPACLIVEEVAVYLEVSLKHVYYLIYMGRLDGWKIRNTWRLFRGSVEAYAHEKNSIGINDNPAGNPDYKGSSRVSALLGNNRSPDDLGQAAERLQGGWRVEHCSVGPLCVPEQALGLGREKQQSNAKVQQYELVF